jgi:hypothetical protein
MDTELASQPEVVENGAPVESTVPIAETPTPPAPPVPPAPPTVTVSVETAVAALNLLSRSTVTISAPDSEDAFRSYRPAYLELLAVVQGALGGQ